VVTDVVTDVVTHLNKAARLEDGKQYVVTDVVTDVVTHLDKAARLEYGKQYVLPRHEALLRAVPTRRFKEGSGKVQGRARACAPRRTYEKSARRRLSTSPRD
jgi:hypothetical protein